MKFCFKKLCYFTTVLQICITLSTTPSNAHCLKDYPLWKSSDAKKALKWGSAALASWTALGLGAWGLSEAIEYVKQQYNLYNPQPNPCHEQYYNSTACDASNAHQGSLAGGIVGSVVGGIGDVLLLAPVLYSTRKAYLELPKVLELRKNRKFLESLVDIPTDNRFSLELVQLYEKVGLGQNLDILDVYFNLLIHGVEKDEICPNGKDYSTNMIVEWIKSKSPITFEDLSNSNNIEIHDLLHIGSTSFTEMKAHASAIHQSIVNVSLEKKEKKAELNRCEGDLLKLGFDIQQKTQTLDNTRRAIAYHERELEILKTRMEGNNQLSGIKGGKESLYHLRNNVEEFKSKCKTIMKELGKLSLVRQEVEMKKERLLDEIQMVEDEVSRILLSITMSSSKHPRSLDLEMGLLTSKPRES